MATVFSQDVVDKAWERAKGTCECKRGNHGHGQPHAKKLLYAQRGRDGQGAWEAHHVNPNGPNSASNCLILCWPCHKATF